MSLSIILYGMYVEVTMDMPGHTILPSAAILCHAALLTIHTFSGTEANSSPWVFEYLRPTSPGALVELVSNSPSLLSLLHSDKYHSQAKPDWQYLIPVLSVNEVRDKI